MSGSFLSGHSRIHKADPIGNVMIAKDQVHPRLILLVEVDVIEPFWPVALKPLAVVAGKIEIQRTPEDTFVGCHPPNPLLARQRQRLFRNASLGRPQSLRTNTEERLVGIERPSNLETSVIGMTEPPRRKTQPGRGLRPDVGVTQQRQDRVKVRGGGKLNRSVF